MPRSRNSKNTSHYTNLHGTIALGLSFAVTRDNKYLWLAGGALCTELFASGELATKLNTTFLFIPITSLVSTLYTHNLRITFLQSATLTTFTVGALKAAYDHIANNDIGDTLPSNPQTPHYVQAGLKDAGVGIIKNHVTPLFYTYLSGFPDVLRSMITDGLTKSGVQHATSSILEKTTFTLHFLSGASESALNYLIYSLATHNPSINWLCHIAEPIVSCVTEHLGEKFASSLLR